MPRLANVVTCLLLLSAPLLAGAATTIYKKVDADGNVTFTDVPPRATEQAEAIDLEAPNSFTPPPEPVPAASPEQPESDAPRATQYKALQIVSPANDEAIRANAGNLTVSAQVDPPLAANHRVRLLMDGAVVGTPNESGTFTLANIDRGTHQLQAQVVDEDGSVVFAGPTSVFHLLRYSALRPGLRRPPPPPR